MISIAKSEVDRLLPMHLFVDADGAVASMGRTLRKFFPTDPKTVDQINLTGVDSQKLVYVHFSDIADREERILLHHSGLELGPFRGHITQAQNGFLLNFGFGIALREVTQLLGLSYSNFSPVSLAMDALFLHEANTWILSELTRNNDALDHARLAAEHQSSQDPLTGLANRRGFELAVGPLCESATTAHGFSIVALDLDYFKIVNDKFGHAAGDLVLQRVGGILRRETRASDIVARLGGDEFVMVLVDFCDIDQLAQFTERLIRRLEEPIAISCGSAHISASIGLVRSSDCIGGDITTMIAQADAALYKAKQQGRGRAVFADKSG